MKYPIVFWDVGGTLFSPEKQDHDGCDKIPSPAEVRKQRAFRAKKVLAMFGHTVPEDLENRIDSLHTTLLEKEQDRFSHIMLAETIYKELGISSREETFYLADAIAGPRYRCWLYKGVESALRQLSEAGIRMGIIANTYLTERMMRTVLEGVGLLHYFETVICSCDVEVSKPDPRIFQKALDRLNLPQGHVPSILFVGDTIEYDVKGANSVGWDVALHLINSEQTCDTASLIFREYDELVSFVLSESS
ncbi:MAG: HAD-IA family hydrolase [Candidatus Ratteibacteria bacterium]